MRTGAIVVLTLLGLFILGSALYARPQNAPVSTLPAQEVTQAGVSEQRLRLSTGRVVTCLVFPSNAVSCDWRALP